MRKSRSASGNQTSPLPQVLWSGLSERELAATQKELHSQREIGFISKPYLPWIVYYSCCQAFSMASSRSHDLNRPFPPSIYRAKHISYRCVASDADCMFCIVECAFRAEVHIIWCGRAAAEQRHFGFSRISSFALFSLSDDNSAFAISCDRFSH